MYSPQYISVNDNCPLKSNVVRIRESIQFVHRLSDWSVI